jgi:predicted DNA-binding protein with PD1-like motif
MYWEVAGNDIFIRIDSGEKLVSTLRQASDVIPLRNAAIVSGVGMLDGIDLGFFNASIDDYDHRRFDGIFDLSTVAGNIIRRSGEAMPHVHAVFNDARYQTYSGHVIEATCYITIELFLSNSAIALRRVKFPGCPATKIVNGWQDGDT